MQAATATMEAMGISIFIFSPLRPSLIKYLIVLGFIAITTFFNISYNVTLMQRNHALLHRIYNISRMGCYNDGCPTLVDVIQQLHNAVCCFGVKVPCRLVAD